MILFSRFLANAFWHTSIERCEIRIVFLKILLYAANDMYCWCVWVCVVAIEPQAFQCFDDDDDDDDAIDVAAKRERKKYLVPLQTQEFAVKYVYRDLVLLRFWHPMLSKSVFTFALSHSLHFTACVCAHQRARPSLPSSLAQFATPCRVPIKWK